VYMCVGVCVCVCLRACACVWIYGTQISTNIAQQG